jgi:hypothetical protein
MPLFAILLPIIRPPVFLPLAIECIQAQTVTDFELYVICDGAPPETVACAEGYARRDPRVKVHAHPKGERQGEAYRHSALMQSEARYVAHLCDDDLWLPDHLAEMEILLSTADFGNLLHVFVHPDGAIELLPGNLARPETRQRMLTEKFNIFGPTYAGYRMDAYRRLPVGWAPAPTEIWTDLHMWRKFLAMENFTFATRAVVTAIHFATPHRLDVPLEQRQEENREHLAQIRDPRLRGEIVQKAWLSLVDRSTTQGEQIIALSVARMQADADLAQARAAFDATDAARATAQTELATAKIGLASVTAQLATTGARLATTEAGLATSRTEIARVTAEHEATEAARAAAQTELAAAKIGLASATAQLATTEARLATTEAALATSQAEIARVTGEHEVTEAARTAVQTALARSETGRRDAEQHLANVLASKSWRLTAPLRRLLKLARR